MVAVDVTDADLLESAVRSVTDRFGRLDVVVASADTSEPSNIETFGDDAWERLRAMNLDAIISLARLAGPALRATHGNFVAISSIAGLRGDWGQFAYNATKAAVNALVQSLALDLGADGVRVNAIAPAFTVSRLTQERLDDPGIAAVCVFGWEEDADAIHRRMLDRVTSALACPAREPQ